MGDGCQQQTNTDIIIRLFRAFNPIKHVSDINCSNALDYESD